MTNINDSRDDARRTAESVLKKDRRRIRVLAGLTIGLWILSGLLIPAIYFPLEAHVMPKFEVMEKLAERADPKVDAQFVAAQVASAGKAAVFATVGFLSIFTITSLLAALSTVVLVLTVRRVTLRQVSEQLAEISQQLRRLQPG